MKKNVSLLFIILLIPALVSSPAAADSESALSISEEEAALIEHIDSEFTGDLDQIKSRKLIRVLINFSRTNFFFHKSKPQGFEYELLKAYEKHAEALNRQLVQKGKIPVDITLADAFIVTEDILELVNAGIAELTVTDQHIAKSWASVLPDIVIHDDIVINSGGKITMAVRKENRQLLNRYLSLFYIRYLIVGDRRFGLQYM